MIVVYDSIVAESRIVGNESESAGEFKDSIDMVVENVVEKPPLNDDPVVEYIDEFEATLRFKQTVKTIP